MINNKKNQQKIKKVERVKREKNLKKIKEEKKNKLIRTKKSWIVISFLIFFILVGFFVNYETTKNLKSIPTCLYGCDYYYENGGALDYYYQPTHTWQSSSQDWLGWLNSLPKSYAFMEYLTSFITSYRGLHYWKNIIVMYYFLIIIGIVGWYFLFKKIFRREDISLLLTFFITPFASYPMFKYSFGSLSFLPWLLYFMLLMLEFKKINLKNVVYFLILNFLIVLYSNYHSMLFFMAYFLLAFEYFFFIILPLSKKDFTSLKNFMKYIKNKILKLNSITIILTVIFSFVLNLLVGWWYQVIFVYGGASNPFIYDIHINYSILHNYIKYAWVWFHKVFWNPGDTSVILFNIVVIISIFLFLVTYKRVRTKDETLFYTILWISTTYLFGIFSYLITIPLFHEQLSPEHAFTFFTPIFRALFIGFFLFFIINWKTYKDLPKKAQNGVYFSLILLFVILISLHNIVSYNSRINNSFFENGYNNIPSQYQALNLYFKENHVNPENTIILTTNELSFALHGLFAVKLLVGRQSHFFIFGNFQKLWMDETIILYSKNNTERYKVLKKYYDIAKKEHKDLYLYWDFYWIPSEWQATKSGVYPFDPLRFNDTKERENILKRNGIKYFVVKNDVFEPSGRGNPDVTHLNILYVSPQNYFNYTNPWNPNLNKYLKKVWGYKYHGKEIADLYKIVMS